MEKYSYSVKGDVEDGRDWSVIGDADLCAIVEQQLYGRLDSRIRRVVPLERIRSDCLTIYSNVHRNLYTY